MNPPAAPMITLGIITAVVVVGLVLFVVFAGLYSFVKAVDAQAQRDAQQLPPDWENR